MVYSYTSHRDPSYEVPARRAKLLPPNESILEQGTLFNDPLKTFSKVETRNSAARHDFPLVCPNCVKLKSLLELISRSFIRP